MLTVMLKKNGASVALKRLTHAVSDMSPVMNSIGEPLEFSTAQPFNEGVSPPQRQPPPR